MSRRDKARALTLRKNLETLKANLMAMGTMCALRADCHERDTKVKAAKGNLSIDHVIGRYKKINDLRIQAQTCALFIEHVDETIGIDNAMRSKRK